MTTLTLALLALLLAGPLPAVLARTTRIRHSPMAAMVLWQALALAAVLAATGAGLSLATWTGIGPHNSLLQYVVAAGALALTWLVLWRLARCTIQVGTELRSLRRRHRRLLDLLAEDRHGVRVIDHEAPTAYCVPGVVSASVVVSRGALNRLGEAALGAVLEHERSHLRARHDLVLEAFTVLHRAFPAVLSSRSALEEVTLLVEVLADRAAVHRVGRRPLVEALSALVGATTPRAALGAGGGIVARLEVLRDPRPHHVQSIVLVLIAVSLLVLPTVLVALPWLTSVAWSDGLLGV